MGDATSSLEARLKLAIGAVFTSAIAVACAQPAHTAGAKPEGSRLISGAVDPSTAAQIGPETTGVQIAAVAIGTKENPKRIDLFGSDVLDASHPASFANVVDGTRSFVVILQIPTGAANGAGRFLGVLHFGDGRGGDATLLPPGTDDITLGTIQLNGAILTVDDADNPLGQIDTDKDGTPDLIDTDDDGDGIPDAQDPDNGNDGVPDAQQLLDPTDANGDGIPDQLEHA
jgi:hypothetical protein